MIRPGDVLSGIVLEVKEKTAVIKFETKTIEARVIADLETGEKIKVRVKGWYNGKLLLKVLGKNPSSSNSIDLKA